MGSNIERQPSLDEVSNRQSRFSSIISHAPMHKEHCVKVDEVGMLSNSKHYWPVLVLREEMVPDLVREDHSDDTVPVLFLHMLDILYVLRKDVYPLEESQRSQIFGLLKWSNINDRPLIQACMDAALKLSPLKWLEKICKEYGTSTQQLPFGILNFGGNSTAKRTYESSDGEEPSEEPDRHHKVKRVKQDSWLTTNASTTGSDKTAENGDDDKTICDNDESGTFHGPEPTPVIEWNVEEDAELLRLRERGLGEASWEDTFYAFQQKYHKYGLKLIYVRSRYRQYLHPEAYINGSVPKDVCEMARALALSCLSSKENAEKAPLANGERKSDSSSDITTGASNSVVQPHIEGITGTNWTAEEDVEVIRLWERCGETSWLKVMSLFQKRFPQTFRTSEGLRDRYTCYLQKDAFLMSARAGSREYCDEMRARALSLLASYAVNTKVESQLDDHIVTQPSGRQNWSGNEDAHVLWLYETVGETSWKRVEELLRKTFPDNQHNHEDIRSRYRDYLQPEAWLKGSKFNRYVCDDMRARALSLLDHIDTSLYNGEDIAQDVLQGAKGIHPENKFAYDLAHGHDFPENPDLSGGSGTKWTAEEDGRLIQIREVVLKDASWQQCFNAFKKAFPRTSRTRDGMKARYRYVLAESAARKAASEVERRQREEMRHRAQAFLTQFGPDLNLASIISVSVKGWTTKEDAELIRLREQRIKGPEWKRIAAVLKKRILDSVRTPEEVQNRYKRFLTPNANGNSTINAKECAELRNRALTLLINLDLDSDEDEMTQSCVGAVDNGNWTIAEDAELVRLRERLAFKLQWNAILESFDKKFPIPKRTIKDLRERYEQFLEDKSSSHNDAPLSASRKLRERALLYLDNFRHLSEPLGAVKPKSKREIISLLSDDEEVKEGSDHDENDEPEGDYEDNSSLIVRGESDRELVSDEESDDEIEGPSITIIIGKEQEYFRIPLDRILGNSYFVQDTRDNDELGTYVTGFRWAQIKPEQFRPIYEYLKYGDYRPFLDGDKLIGISSDHDHGREVVRSGLIFTLARELQIYELMDLTCLKLAVLKKDPLSVLMAVRKVFQQDKISIIPAEHGTTHDENGSKQDQMMRDMLIEEVVKNYWDYMGSNARNMQRQARKTPDFYREVLKRHGAAFEQEISITK